MTTIVYPFCLFLEKYLAGSSWIDATLLWLIQSFGLVEAQWWWFSVSDNYGGIYNVRSSNLDLWYRLKEYTLLVRSKLCVPKRIDSVIMSFHQGMMASIRSNGEVSDPFIVSNETKQVFFSCTSYLVGIFLSLENVNEVVRFKFNARGRLSEQLRLNAWIKTSVQTVGNLVFADNWALVANTVEDDILFFFLNTLVHLKLLVWISA